MAFKNWHALAFISCAVLLAYYPVLFAPLNPVDDVRMVNDLLNRPGFSWADFLFPVSRSYYRPVVASTFILDTFLWNLEAPFLHLENLLLHLSNVILFFFLTQQVGRLSGVDGVGRIALPTIAALLFGLHPVNTEAVLWIAGRADLLAGFFVLSCVLSAVSFLIRPKRRWLMATAAAFFCGCLSKETALFIWPGLLLAGVAVRKMRRDEDLSVFTALSPALICLPALAGYFSLRFYALHGRDLGLNQVHAVLSQTADLPANLSVSGTVVSLTYADRLLKMLAVFGFYLRKLIQPFPLNFGILDVPEWYTWVGLALVICCCYLLWRLTLPNVFFLSAASLASVALLVAFGGLSWTPVAERYMYLPSAMFVLGGGLMVQPLLSDWYDSCSSNLLKFVVVLIVVAAGASVASRAMVWQDNVTLFRDTVQKSPNFTVAQNTLAVELMKKGERAEAVAILRDLDLPKFQVASLNKVIVMIEDGEYLHARDFLIERLNTPVSYQRTILEKLVKVMVLLHDNASEPEVKVEYRQEQLRYLEMLWESTREPFYLYQVGRLHMEMGHKYLAQTAFAQAYEMFPENSLYKQPAGKLAETLKE